LVHPFTLTQNIFLSWLNHVIIAAALINQTITEWDRKLKILQSLNNHKVICINHIMIASIDAYIIKSLIHKAKGARVAAVIRDITVTGHVDNCLELLNKPQIITGRKAVYNQICGGTQTREAYAIAWGIKIIATVIQAMVSAFKTCLSFNSGIHSRNGKNFFKLFLSINDIKLSKNYT